MIRQEFMAQHGVYEQGRNGLADRLVEAWQDMRGSTRRLIRENPSEQRLLFYVLLSDLIVFTSWSLKTTVAPALSISEEIPLEIAAYLVTALFLRTVFMFVFSILIGSAARIAGGTGTWRETRAATFWGCLVAAPIGFFVSAVSIVISLAEQRWPALSIPDSTMHLYWVSMIPFVWYISAGIAEAHGFRRAWTVFAIMALIGMAGAAFALYLTAQGIV